MALTGIDINETIEYISEKDPDKAAPTVFVIGIITNKEKTRIMAKSATTEGGIELNLFELFLVAIREIRNLRNPKTGELETKKEVTEDVLNQLPAAVVLEVGAKALAFNGLSEQEQKN